MNQTSPEAADPQDIETAVHENAQKLVAAYLELKCAAVLKKSLTECLAQEILKIEELKEMYLEDLRDVKFLSAAYFQDHQAFVRNQDIPEHYFVRGCKVFLFISHRWETQVHPDPSGRQFEAFKVYQQSFPMPEREGIGYWYDFSCCPQPDSNGYRNPGEEAEFARLLRVMHLLTALSLTVVLYAPDYLGRSWCCSEWIMASHISPIKDPGDHSFPFGNIIKFRQIAILTAYLHLSAELQQAFMKGDDIAIMALINSLLSSVMALTEATYAGDKRYLQDVVHRHFWYHVRMMGLRTELLTALRILEQFEAAMLYKLFAQLVILSNDPYLHWTRTATVSFETMLFNQPDPFAEIRFHGNLIEVTSASSFTFPAAPKDPLPDEP